jgi:hypothetical protein
LPRSSVPTLLDEGEEYLVVWQRNRSVVLSQIRFDDVIDGRTESRL